MIKANSIEDILPGGDNTSYQACDSELCVCRSLHISIYAVLSTPEAWRTTFNAPTDVIAAIDLKLVISLAFTVQLHPFWPWWHPNGSVPTMPTRRKETARVTSALHIYNRAFDASPKEQSSLDGLPCLILRRQRSATCSVLSNGRLSWGSAMIANAWGRRLPFKLLLGSMFVYSLCFCFLN